VAKITKPDYSEQWASAGNIVAPNSVKIQTVLKYKQGILC